MKNIKENRNRGLLSNQEEIPVLTLSSGSRTVDSKSGSSTITVLKTDGTAYGSSAVTISKTSKFTSASYNTNTGVISYSYSSNTSTSSTASGTITVTFRDQILTFTLTQQKDYKTGTYTSTDITQVDNIYVKTRTNTSQYTLYCYDDGDSYWEGSITTETGDKYNSGRSVATSTITQNNQRNRLEIDSTCSRLYYNSYASGMYADFTFNLYVGDSVEQIFNPSIYFWIPNNDSNSSSSSAKISDGSCSNVHCTYSSNTVISSADDLYPCLQWLSCNCTLVNNQVTNLELFKGNFAISGRYITNAGTGSVCNWGYDPHQSTKSQLVYKTLNYGARKRVCRLECTSSLNVTGELTGKGTGYFKIMDSNYNDVFDITTVGGTASATLSPGTYFLYHNLSAATTQEAIIKIAQ